LVADPSTGGEALIAKLRELGLDARRPSTQLCAFETREELDDRGLTLMLEEHAVLGLFPQSSSDLLQDYDALLQELADESADLDVLLAAGRLLLPAAFRGDAHRGDDDDRAGHPLIFADPTQRDVLDECRRNLGVVVDGPPGTGKSQVIVNLILDAVRRGERVAVVCEKRAALDVVYQRVEGLGLAHALALVHDTHEDRKPLYEQIGKRIEDFEPLSLDEEAASTIEASHAEATAALEDRSALLRERVAGTELSVGQLYALRSGVTRVALNGSSLGALSQERVEELVELLEGLHPLRDLWGPDSPFRSPEGIAPRKSLADLDADALRALSQALARAEERAAAYESALGGASVPSATLERITPAIAADRDMRALRGDADAERVYLAAVERTDALDAGLDIEAAR
ncbi:MAG: hypothetical protein H5U40_11895, partial [Polyangiaceae bacterium]|nr:hypothetical protein [Polyangiaceae bacterium]